MSINQTRQWPNIRLDPAIKSRLEKILTDAKNGASLISIANALLAECVDAITHEGDHIPPIPTIAVLRQQLGLISLEEAKSEVLAEIQARLSELERKLSPTARAAEDPAPYRTGKAPKPSSRNKRS